MGKHFWMKQDEHEHKQPGCLSGLINVLDYHHWHSNTRKMIHQNKYAGQTGLNRDWRIEMSLLPHGSCEVEKLLDEKQSPFLKSKRTRGTNKRSLKSRLKALIAEEIYKESNNAQTKEGFLYKSRLQRTYSIHHLESLDDSISKICTDWKNPIIFIPSKVENYVPRSVDITRNEPADLNGESVRESNMFSVATIGSFGKIDFLDIFKVNKELFVKCLQIPDESATGFSGNGLDSDRRLKLSKSRSFPDLDSSRRLKFKPSKLTDKQKEVWSFPKGEKSQAAEFDIREETTMNRVSEITVRNYSNCRSSSLNESLDRYAGLFENSYGSDAKLNPSRGLRLTNSNADSFLSNLNLGVVGDYLFGNGSLVAAKDGGFGTDIVVEDEEKVVRLVASDSEKEPLDLIETVGCTTESVYNMQGLEDDKDLGYVKLILDQSGVAKDAAERAWHASDQPLSPRIFENVEACWPHEHDQLTSWSDSCSSCWEHQMLFDLVNEALVETYDVSLPYYPKALLSGCHVRPFPVGNRIIEQVSTSISRLLNLRMDAKQWFDCIMVRDLKDDYRWMI